MTSHEFRWQRGCPSDGQLRALLDASESDSGWAHPGTCPRCTHRLAELRHVASITRTLLGHIDPTIVVNEDESFRRLRPRLTAASSGATVFQADTGGSWMSELFARRAVRASSAAVAAVAMVVVLALSPMRTVADDFLNQFRVQKFAAVTIPMDLIEPFNSGILQTLSEDDKAAMKERFDALGTFETTFNMEDLPQPGTLEDAQATYGDFVSPDADDLPDGFDDAPSVYVTEAGNASYALNLAQARGIIDDMNLPIYALDDIDATTLDFEVNVPQAVVLEYKNASGERVLVGQMASPELSFPDELDMNQLREEILRFPGLPTDLVAQLSAIDDWENTLIIPIPQGAESDDVTINGEPGLLIEHDLGAAILWEDDGILYAVVGQVSSDAMQDIADSMD